MIGAGGGGGVGNVTVVTTENRGHSPEELADMALDKIMYVADTAPQPIRDQAHAYRERIRHILIHFMYRAQQSEHTTINAKLLGQGFPEMADAIRNGDL